MSGLPSWTAICHCSICRRTHSAPYAELCAYDDVRITRGESNLSMYNCGGQSKEDRYFCSTCGSKVYSRLNHLGCCAVFLQNFTTPNHGADGEIDPRFKMGCHIYAPGRRSHATASSRNYPDVDGRSPAVGGWEDLPNRQMAPFPGPRCSGVGRGQPPKGDGHE